MICKVIYRMSGIIGLVQRQLKCHLCSSKIVILVTGAIFSVVMVAFNSIKVLRCLQAKARQTMFTGYARLNLILS